MTFHCQKKLINNKSIIELKKLNNDDKLNEIARMLSGKEITEEAISAGEVDELFITNVFFFK